MIDHDRLFKELLTTFFVEFIDLFLPDVSGYLDPASLEFLDKEIFTDVTSGERREADLVVKGRFQHGEAFFLVHVETQAAPQEAFARRMFYYFARLHEKHDLPIYPVALLTYDSPKRAEPDRYRVEFPEFRVIDFAFKAIQLNRLDWGDYLERPNPVASALMAKMNIRQEDRPRVKVECLRLLATLRLDAARIHLISGFVDTYLRLNRVEEQVFEAELATVAPSERETVMEIVTSWMEEGIERGLERGIERGLERGIERGLERGLEQGQHQAALNFVMRHLSRKLNRTELDPTLENQVASLSTLQLEALDEALPDLQNIEEILRWLDSAAQ